MTFLEFLIIATFLVVCSWMSYLAGKADGKKEAKMNV
jgi:hypothetical protein